MCSKLCGTVVLVTASFVVSCGPPPPLKNASVRNSTKDEEPPLRIEPIHVRAIRDRERLAIEAYDAAELFERASRHLREGLCEEAVLMYRRLTTEFSTSRFAAPSLYNCGLCNEQLGQHQEAAGDYLRLIEKYPDSRDVTDAMFRLAAAYEELEAWDDAVKVFDSLLRERNDLEGIERVEALARKGSDLIHLGKRDDAKVALTKSTQLFRAGRGVSPSAPTFFYAMAQFKIGEILQIEMRESELPAEEAQIEPALERKCRLLLEAQEEYTRTIKIAHPHWAAAAAYRIGNLYRSLWDDMVTAPVPKDLGAEEQRIYTDVLKELIRVLLKRAVVQWERTLKMARRLNLSNDWIDQTKRELEEIREIMSLETDKPPEN